MGQLGREKENKKRRDVGPLGRDKENKKRRHVGGKESQHTKRGKKQRRMQVSIHAYAWMSGAVIKELNVLFFRES